MEKNKVIDLVFQVLVFIIIVGGLIFIIGFIGFQKMKEIPEQYCNDIGGQYVYYECQEIPFSNSPCSELKTGYWCNFPDGRSINETEIWRIFNSTN